MRMKKGLWRQAGPEAAPARFWFVSSLLVEAWPFHKACWLLFDTDQFGQRLQEADGTLIILRPVAFTFVESANETNAQEEKYRRNGTLNY